MKIKIKKIVPIIIMLFMIIAYISPLLVNLNKSFTLFPKNIVQYYMTYFECFSLRNAVIANHQFPLWVSGYDGGINFFAFPSTIYADPTSIFALFFNEIVSDKLAWAVFYILGALSMYYLCFCVLRYNWAGSIFSSIVYTMGGYFSHLQEESFIPVRVTLLLPLFFAFLIKAKANRVFLFFAAFVLAFISLESALLLPVIVLFTALFVICQKDFRFFVIYICICLMAFLYSFFKTILTLDMFWQNVQIINKTHEYIIKDANTIGTLLYRLIFPENFGVGMYVGIVPVLICIVVCFINFKTMFNFVVCLIIAVWLSLGPNSLFDLNRALWQMPLFGGMHEVAKYYGLVIVFFMSVICGGFFSFIEKIRNRFLADCLSCALIGFVFLNLLWFNVGYFNVFNTTLPEEKGVARDFYNILAINLHPGDESVTAPLSYFLARKNIGLLNMHQHPYLRKSSNVVPKYILLPKYAFLVPSTRLVVLPNPEYKGEFFFLNKSLVSKVRFRPGELIFDVRSLKPDILIINQNFDRGWKATAGKVENHLGLLSVRFDRPLDSRVRLTFLPGNFIIGILISLLAVILSLVYLKKKRK